MSSLPWIAHWGWQRRGKQSPWGTIKPFHHQDWLPLAFWEKRNFSYFQPLKLLMCWGLCNVWSTLVESGKTLSGPVKISRFPGPNWKPSQSSGMNHSVTHFRGGSSHSISPPLCHLARFRRWGKLVTFFSHGTEQLWRPLAFWLAFLPTANANLKAVGS